MTELKTRKGRLISLPVLALIVAALALLVFQAREATRSADAYPGLTAGIDLDASTTTDIDNDGDYDSINLSTFEDCVTLTNGQLLTVDVFVLDVVDLVAFNADVEYNPSVINILSVDTNEFLGAQVGSTVVDVSGGITGPGTYNTAAFDQSNQGDDGSGILVSINLQAIASGVSPFNIDITPLLSRGITLKNSLNVSMGDTNSDGFYDGPYINENANIAVDTSDLDGDTIPDACDNDLDGDGFDNGVDNCPNIFNPTQSDIDFDGKGDPCDTYDADGDGYKNDLETLHGSNTLDPASRPEVCDGIDNDGDTQVDEGRGSPNVPFRDQDGDTVPDCTDSNVDTDGDTIVNTSDNDDDGDGITDTDEHQIITDSLRKCHNGVEYPDWPPDFDNNKVINVTDVFQVLPPAFGTAPENPFFKRRADIAPNGVINVTDIFRVLPPVFGTSCT